MEKNNGTKGDSYNNTAISYPIATNQVAECEVGATSTNLLGKGDNNYFKFYSM